MTARLTGAQWALASYMSDLSEEAYCAGWMGGLEDALWGILTDPNGDRHYGMTEFTPEQVARLRELHELCGGWIYWNNAETFATTDEWLEMHAKALAGHIRESED